jgi:hypothetical protein
LASAFYYGMNQTVINTVFPTLLPRISRANKLRHPVIDVYDALGGKEDWNASFRPGGCGTLAFGGPPVPSWKDIPECTFHCGCYQHGTDPWPISCDNCHPSPYGYSVLAAAVKAAITRTGMPPPPPPPGTIAEGPSAVGSHLTLFSMYGDDPAGQQGIVNVRLNVQPYSGCFYCGLKFNCGLQPSCALVWNFSSIDDSFSKYNMSSFIDISQNDFVWFGRSGLRGETDTEFRGFTRPPWASSYAPPHPVYGAF